MTTLQELANWKAQAIAVENEWDAQAVGRLLNVPIGASIRAAVQPGVEKLQEQVATLRAACRKADVLLTSFAVARNLSEHQKDAAVEVLTEVVAALTATMPTEGCK